MSKPAAEAAWCALDQGQYWPYHEMIFENHPSFGGEPFSDDGFIAFAEELGLDMNTFTSCFQSGEHTQDVLDSLDAGAALGVNGTPSIFINGEKISYGGWENLAQQIDALLAAE